MFKKIMLWTVYVVIVGLLIFGAVNRTSAKADQGILFGKTDEINDGRGRGNNGSDNFIKSGEMTEAAHEEISEEQDWGSLSGQIIIVSPEALEIQTGSAGILEISGRSWRFAQELGYFPEEGNEVTVEGFYENGEFEVSTILDLSTGQIFLLREDSGRPLWSGGGRN